MRNFLSEFGVALRNEEGDEKTLEELRAMYEPYTHVLSHYLMMPLPGWLPKARATDNWQTSAFENARPAPNQPIHKCLLATPAAKAHSAAAITKSTD